MSRSPTLENAYQNFNQIKKRMGAKYDKNQTIFGILFIYPFLVLFLLFYLRPSFILVEDDRIDVYNDVYNDKYNDDNDDNYDNYNKNIDKYNKNNKYRRPIDYKKAIAWFIGFQTPIIVYFLLK